MSGVSVPHGDASYELGACLGRGGFGVCFKAVERQRREQREPAERVVAVKKISMRQVRLAHKEPHLRYEIRLHSQLRHRNVVLLQDSFVHEDYVYFVLEYCCKKSLADIVAQETSLPTELAAYYFKQLVDGLQHVHGMRILHRDLKLSNILVDRGDTAKISDFGLACTFTRSYLERHLACGTPNYLSPEVLLRRGHTTKSDIWSCGVVLFAMFGGVPPFQTDSIAQIYRNIVAGSYAFSDEHHADRQLRDLVGSMLRLEPDSRPDLDEIAAHQFCTNAAAYQLQLNKKNRSTTSCTNLRRSKSMRTLSKSLSNLFSKNSRPDLRKSTERLFGRGLQLALPKSLTVVDLKRTRIASLLEHFRAKPAWGKRATDFCGNWVTWWRDSSDKCGLYYQLSGAYDCALYNDGVSCQRDRRNGRLHFAEAGAVVAESAPDAVERFYEPIVRDLTLAFSDVADAGRLPERLSWICSGAGAGFSFLTDWHRHEPGPYHVFHLSDESVQVNFASSLILRLCGSLCYFYQPARNGFVMETAELQSWCLQDVNAELADALCSIFL